MATAHIYLQIHGNEPSGFNLYFEAMKPYNDILHVKRKGLHFFSLLPFIKYARGMRRIMTAEEERKVIKKIFP